MFKTFLSRLESPVSPFPRHHPTPASTLGKATAAAVLNGGSLGRGGNSSSSNNSSGSYSPRQHDLSRQSPRTRIKTFVGGGQHQYHSQQLSTSSNNSSTETVREVVSGVPMKPGQHLGSSNNNGGGGERFSTQHRVGLHTNGNKTL